MRKFIRNIGTSIGVIFNSEEQQIYGFKEGITVQFRMGTRSKKGELDEFHYKKIRRIGNSLGIIFNTEEVQIYKLKSKEIIQMQITSKISEEE